MIRDLQRECRAEYPKNRTKIDSCPPLMDRVYASNEAIGQPTAFPGLDPTLRSGAVLKIVGCSRTALYNMLQKGGRYEDKTFPRPVKLSKNPKSRAVGWRSSLIIAWLNSRD